MRVWLTALLAALALPAAAPAGTVFLLDGRGWGHGVGMSQWGAEGYARHGYDYKRILAHYYRGTALATVHPRPVRVLLARDKHAITVGSSAPFVVTDASGRKFHLRASTITVKRPLKLKHRKLRFPVRIEPGVQPLSVEFAGYRGDVVVHAAAHGVTAVNVLPLDRYLRGVVPWEVPRGWHEATYLAQAVAARSYTLATLHPGKDFDLFPDQRSQMYGGIRAERPETNLAIGATAGQVLTYGGAIIACFYFSTSGGHTSSVHDAWPRATQVPYLVSVSDPYDYISPHHVWPTTILTAARIAHVLHLRAVRDAVVVRNSSGRASAVRVLSAAGWRTFTGPVIRKKFRLGSTDFELRAMSLDPLPLRVRLGERVGIRGWVRGLGRARLQALTGQGWATIAHLHPSPNGHFVVTMRARHSTQLRLAYNGLAGSAETLRVSRRLSATSK
jgi:stage II sporulation protein D